MPRQAPCWLGGSHRTREPPARSCAGRPTVACRRQTVRVPRPVNDAQRAVLEWLATGATCDPPEPTYKLSAAALKSRGLVSVRRFNGKWTAALTDDGRYFVENGTYPPEPEKATEPVHAADGAEPQAPTARGGRSSGAKPKTPAEPAIEVDCPKGVRAHGLKPKGDALRHSDDPDPWDSRIMISVKEAAWLLSLSEHEIRRAVTEGEIDRVFIGKGTTNYRVVYGSLLAWVNDMPRESSRHSWWSRW